ncbi:tetratricopeptide repeat protein [bacterium]|nr:tetratricopeptide repeat protein [bacterium]
MMKRDCIAHVVCLIVALASLAVCCTEADCAASAPDIYKTATGAMRDELWDFAGREFETLLKAYPKAKQAESSTYYLGFCDFQRKHYKTGAHHLDSYLSRWPKAEFARESKFYLGRCLLEIGQPERAKLLFENVASTKHELRIAATFWLGRAHLTLGHFAESRDLFALVVQSKDPAYSETAVYELARADSEGKNYLKSIKTALRLVQTSKDKEVLTQTRLLLAINHFHIEKFHLAISYARKVIDVVDEGEERWKRAIVVLAESYRLSGQHEEAFAAFGQYLKVAAADDAAGWAAERATRSLISSEKYDEAQAFLAHWKNKLAEETICELAFALADHQRALGRTTESMDALRLAYGAMSSRKFKLSTGLRLADAYFKSADYAKVLLVLKPLLPSGSLVEDKDLIVSALLLVGMSDEALNGLADAERAYRLILSLEPSREQAELASSRLIEVLLRRNNIDSAIVELDAIKRLSGTTADYAKLAAQIVDYLSKRNLNQRAVASAKEYVQKLSSSLVGSGKQSGEHLRAFLRRLSESNRCLVLQQLVETLKPEPQHSARAEVLLSAAECYFGLHEYASASTVYSEVIDEYRNTPQAAVALGRLGTIAFEAGNYAESLEVFEKAREGVDEAPFGIVYMIAESLFRLGKLPEALAEYEALIKMPDCRKQVLQNAILKGAIICEELGMLAKAREGFKACASMDFDKTAASIAKKRLARLGD